MSSGISDEVISYLITVDIDYIGLGVHKYR